MGGERTSLEFSYLYPTFNQHQAVYKFCQKFVKDKNTVDFGCGEGNGTFRLSEVASKAVGLDTSDKSIKSARRKYKSRNLKYYKADISNVRLDRKYDAAVCLQVIEHLDDPHKFLHSVKSALKPGGICIFSIPNKKTQGYNENPYHTREFQERELKELLEKYFKSVKIYGLFGDKYIQSYEKERKLQVMKFMKLDFLGIRKILPRKIKIAFFEFLVPFVRNNVAKKESGEFFKIGTSNYSVRSQTKGAIDFVALCKI